MARTKQNTEKSGGKRISAKKLNLTKSARIKPKTGGVRKPKRRCHPGTKALREIRHYQKRTDLLLRKLPFQRLVRDIVRESGGNSSITEMRMQKIGLPLLQEATESYLVEMFEDSNLEAIHGKRITVMDRDMKLAFYLKHRRTLPKRAYVR